MCPLGGGACPNAAESPPVSEFESPKLNIAGKLHSLVQMVGVGGKKSVIETATDMMCLNFFASIALERKINNLNYNSKDPDQEYNVIF